MNEERDTAREIFPVSLGLNDGPFTDFSAVVRPADAPDEAEAEADPKAESAPEHADSSDTTNDVEQQSPVTPVPPPVPRVTSSPKETKTGS